jgi:hypothetical protein
MNLVDYPWHWLKHSVGTTFIVRFPWKETALQAARTAEKPICVLIPEIAGDLEPWSSWLQDQLRSDGQTDCYQADEQFRDVTVTLREIYPFGAAFEGASHRDWSTAYLADCRREMKHVDPILLLVSGADDDCAAGLQELIKAQRAISYPLVKPVLVRRTTPPAWDGVVVRFGLPEVVGDLHRVAPPPARDIGFWTELVLALTVAWEAAASPALADELWDQLRAGRMLSIRESGFDDWVARRLQEFAAQRREPAAARLPPALAFRPQAELDDTLWQRGVVAWQEGAFDITPLHARSWLNSLEGTDPRESLRRRRLTNVPLTRWLSAWAASIEESLRVAVLQAGSGQFRRFLQSRKPRNQGPQRDRSRWDELAPEENIDAIDAADFGDLSDFLAQSWRGNGVSGNLTTLLHTCRIARNRVVHERRLYSSDLLEIARAVEWLSGFGLI